VGAEDEYRDLFNQLHSESDERLKLLARSVGQFRDELKLYRFTDEEAFDMSRDVLNALLDLPGEPGE
jgi:hypothetical protein